MAPPGKRHRAPSSTKIQVLKRRLTKFQEKYITTEFARRLIFDPNLLWVSAILLLVAECFVNVIVIQRVPCKKFF